MRSTTSGDRTCDSPTLDGGTPVLAYGGRAIPSGTVRERPMTPGRMGSGLGHGVMARGACVRTRARDAGRSSTGDPGRVPRGVTRLPPFFGRAMPGVYRPPFEPLR